MLDKFSELLRRVEITCKARYHSSRRLSFHNLMSQWTLSMLAVGQIVIALIPALGLHTNFRPGYVTFGSIFFAVLVLTYSLLLGMGNYAVRSVKMHGCGLELGRLARELYAIRTNPAATDGDYDRACKDYYDILEKHENHTNSDYAVAHWEYYSSSGALRQGEGNPLGRESGFKNVFSRQTTRLTTMCQTIMQYWHYFFTVGLLWSWIWLLVCG